MASGAATESNVCFGKVAAHVHLRESISMAGRLTLKAVNVLSLLLLFVLPLCWSIVTPVFGSVPWPHRIVDYKLIHEFSHMVATEHVYPPIFPYPPSAVCLLTPFHIFSFSSTAMVWLIVSALCTTGVFIVGSSLVGLEKHPLRWLVSLLAMVSVGYFVVTDLRATNCNMIYLFFLTAGMTCFERGWSKGGSFLLAMSISLKIYSVAVVAYLIARGEWRNVLRTLGWVAVLWIVLPLAIFGLDGTLAVYRSWGDQISRLMLGAEHYDFINLTSLRKGLFAMLGQDIAIPFLLFCRMIWGSLVVTLLTLTALLNRREANDEKVDWALGAGLLALALGATSPFLEVYHFVPAAIINLGLLAIVVQRREPAWVNGMVIAAMICGWGILKFGPKGEERGIGLYLYAIVMASCVVAIWSARLMRSRAIETIAEKPLVVPIRPNATRAA